MKCYNCNRSADVGTRWVRHAGNNYPTCSATCADALEAILTHEPTTEELEAVAATPRAAEGLDGIQLELFNIVACPSAGSIEERFVAFHLANPHVFHALHHLARGAWRDGWQAGSINMFFEQLRWSWAVKTRGSTFKLSNDLRAYYSRALMAYDADLAGFFKLRVQTEEYTPNLEALGLTTYTPNQ